MQSSVTSSPLLSVIVPVFNAAASLQRCVSSILAQSVCSLEVIIVNDGSTDGSGLIASQLAAADARIRVLHLTNGGVSRARNVGLQCATGQWVAFVDADDVISGSNFWQCLSMTDSQQVSVIVQNYVAVQPDGSSVSYSFSPAHHGAILQSVAFQKHYFTCGFFVSSCWAKVFRRSFLSQHDIAFSPLATWSEDLLFVSQALQAAQQILAFNSDDTYIYYKPQPRAGLAKYNTSLTNIRMVQDVLLPLYSRSGCVSDSTDRSILWWYLSAEHSCLGSLHDNPQRKAFYAHPIQQQVEARFLHRHTLQTRVMYSLCKRCPHWSIWWLKKLYFFYRSIFVA